MTTHGSKGKCGDDAKFASLASEALPSKVTPDGFELIQPVGDCVPVAAMNSLPEFLKWFSTATPFICEGLKLKDATCLVLTGDGNGNFVAKGIVEMLNDCGVDVAPPPSLISCADLTAKTLYQGPEGCFPDRIAETGTVVLSADPFTGEVAWRTPPAIDCNILEQFLLPNPESFVGCYPKTAGTPSRVLGFIDNTAALGWFTPPTGGGGPAVPAAITCADVLTVLKDNCIPDGVIEKEVGISGTGLLVKTPRRKLIHAAFRGSTATPVDYTDSLKNHALPANRRIWRWANTDSTITAFAGGQSLGDLALDTATGTFTVGHAAFYDFSAGIFLRMTTTSTTLLTSVRLISAFVINRPGEGNMEIRMHEITQDVGKDDSIGTPSGDFYFSGNMKIFLPAGSTIQVRFWVSPGNAPSPDVIMKVTADYNTVSSYFSIVEVPDFY